MVEGVAVAEVPDDLMVRFTHVHHLTLTEYKRTFEKLDLFNSLLQYCKRGGGGKLKRCKICICLTISLVHHRGGYSGSFSFSLPPAIFIFEVSVHFVRLS